MQLNAVLNISFSVALDAADGMPSEKAEDFLDCVICGQASTSTEDRPIGLVTLLQPSAGNQLVFANLNRTLVTPLTAGK